MDCCYHDDCGEYSVTPVLMAPCYPEKCCEEPPMCYPCLPRCPKVVYCERKCKAPRPDDDDCCDTCERRSGPPPRRPSKRAPVSQSTTNCCHPPADCCPTCYQPTCKPVRTKYVIPCYRYEDGRINQPTVLMRRACEVACGRRQRPFVESSYSSDPRGEFHRFHSEDERGNMCFHVEKKPSCSPGCCAPVPCGHGLCGRLPHHHHACHPCVSSPHCHYTDCVHARVVDPPRCCYYC